MPRNDEQQQAWREALLAFDLAAAALANPVPKLLTDLTAPEESLRDLERELPLAYFSPFGTLPEDIAYDSGEMVHPPAGATRAPDSLAGHKTLRSNTGSALAPADADDLSRATSPGDGSPVFPLRRSDKDMLEGSMSGDATRGHFHGSRTVPKDPEGPLNSARQEPAYDYRNDDSAADAPLSSDPMPLLDGLAEDALGAIKDQAGDVPIHPPNSQSPDPGAHGGETAAPVYPPVEHSLESGDRSVEGLPASVSERFDTPAGTHLEAATDFRKTSSNSSMVNALIHSLVDDLISPPDRTPDYEPEVAEYPGEPLAPNRSTFDEPDGGPPPGAGTPDEGGPEKVPEQYADSEAFAALVNDVLVRQARRHGVDLS